MSVVDLTPILAPIVVAVVLSVSGAYVVARYSGPAQASYIASLEGRLRIVSEERDEAFERMPKLEARIDALEQEVAALRREASAKDGELVDLYRRLSVDERRILRQPEP